MGFGSATSTQGLASSPRAENLYLRMEVTIPSQFRHYPLKVRKILIWMRLSRLAKLEGAVELHMFVDQ
jgi:hypothetical protein